LQVDPDRARKPITQLPPETEYYVEGNTKYGYINGTLYLWTEKFGEWTPYSKYDAERHWKKITKK